jgi:hypothetical protein
MALGDLVKGAAQSFVDNGIKSVLGGFLGGGGPSQGFSAQNIVSSLSKTGVAHSGHFEVQLTGPKSYILKPSQRDPQRDGPVGTATGLSSDDENAMMYRAESAEIPGRSLATVDHRFDNYSPVTRVVTGQTYVDVTVTFLLSEDLREKEYFERWQAAAIGTGAFSSGRADDTRNNPAYYDQYVGSVIIRQYGADGSLRSIHKLENAYPIVMGGVQMNWGDDGHARLTVTFSYNRYTAVFNRQDQAKKGLSGGFSLGPGGLSGSLQIPGIGSFNAGGGRFGANIQPLVGGVSKKIFG